MSNVGFPSNRAIYRFFRDLGEAGIDVLFLSLADHLAARGSALAREDWDWHANMTAYVLEKHFEKAGPTSQPRIIDGRDIMEALHLPAGPIIGEMLGELREAQAAGEITDKPQAVDYLKRIYRERYNNSHI
jgi:poly(A) polymerase